MKGEGPLPVPLLGHLPLDRGQHAVRKPWPQGEAAWRFPVTAPVKVSTTRGVRVGACDGAEVNCAYCVPYPPYLYEPSQRHAYCKSPTLGVVPVT